MSRAKTKADWLLEHPRLDWFLALIGLLVGLHGFSSSDLIGLIGAVGGIAGGLLGMTAVIMGLYAGIKSPAVSLFARLHGRTISKNWSGILMGFAVAGVIALASAVVPIWLGRFALGYAMALTVINMIRLGWFLRTHFALAQASELDEERDKVNW